jgi:hypothetical protein
MLSGLRMFTKLDIARGVEAQITRSYFHIISNLLSIVQVSRDANAKCRSLRRSHVYREMVNRGRRFATRAISMAQSPTSFEFRRVRSESTSLMHFRHNSRGRKQRSFG